MDIFTIFSLHDIYLIIFSIALALGTGSAFLSGTLLLTVLQDRQLSADEYRVITNGRIVIWVGVLLYTMSGIGLFTLSYEAMLSLGIFQASMVVFGILVLTQLVTQYYFLPRLHPEKFKPVTKTLVLFTFFEVVAMASWLFLVLHHAIYRAPISFWLALSLYLTFILFVGYVYTSVIRHMLAESHRRTSVVLAAVVGGLLCVTLSAYFFSGTNDNATVSVALITNDEKETTTESTGPATFLWTEISRHAHIEDCWVAIAGEVFDVTPAAEKYPDLYQCGTDITTAYAEMRPEGISDRVRSYQIGSVGYTNEDVATHNKKDDCWLVIDSMVFDATLEAKLHPAAFNCGEEVSDNYHRNHGADVSDKMMRLYIGRIDDGNSKIPDDNPEQKRADLKPYTELYVKASSWDNHELMVVVEKDAEKLVFIDGKTHEVLGRIHDIGFQPHTSVFSPDARYMYIIARDGWLTKIDLNTLEPIKSVSVGENSRGTALTENGKYLAIGNYAPGNVVMIDAETLEILKTIPTVGELDGVEVESRVGAVVQKDNDIIVALKDLNSVWVIDADADSFEVVEKFWNIGNNQTPLHDAYLTPDGKFYLVAAMGANTVWVLNTETWEQVGEVKTGITPHTGPGATWGTTTYVPAIGEGLITAIDTTTWEPKAYIKTGGPGLFVRSYPKDPMYPYVWADTAFGDHHDEIYVIDARSNKIVETIKPVPGESSWHPEFTLDGQFVYVVSMTANEIEVYDAHDFSLVKRIEANTPSAVSNVGLRIEEPGL